MPAELCSGHDQFVAKARLRIRVRREVNEKPGASGTYRFRDSAASALRGTSILVPSIRPKDP